MVKEGQERRLIYPDFHPPKRLSRASRPPAHREPSRDQAALEFKHHGYERRWRRDDRACGRVAVSHCGAAASHGISMQNFNTSVYEEADPFSTRIKKSTMTRSPGSGSRKTVLLLHVPPVSLFFDQKPCSLHAKGLQGISRRGTGRKRAAEIAAKSRYRRRGVEMGLGPCFFVLTCVQLSIG